MGYPKFTGDTAGPLQTAYEYTQRVKAKADAYDDAYFEAMEVMEPENRSRWARGEKMQKFYAGRPCPKCKHNWVGTKYCSGGCLCSLSLEGEHLHRECQRCGYEWAEATLDSEDQ